MSSAAASSPLTASASSNAVPRLLISVRSLVEADAIANLGIAVLDLKEPLHGALAPASVDLWQQIASRYAASVSLSVALGEFDQAVDLAADVPGAVAFAKAGPANCQTLRQLTSAWTRLRDRLPESVSLVAVAYADHRAAACLPPQEIFEQAASMGIKTWLIDTLHKNGQSTLDQLSVETLSGIAQLAKLNQAQWVLAGSIRLAAARGYARLGPLPDLFGVRGDVCHGQRTGEISPQSVQRWLIELRQLGFPGVPA